MQSGSRFPLDDAGVQSLLENICENVLQIHDIEADAVAGLQAAMG